MYSSNSNSSAIQAEALLDRIPFLKKQTLFKILCVHCLSPSCVCTVTVAAAEVIFKRLHSQSEALLSESLTSFLKTFGGYTERYNWVLWYSRVPHWGPML